MTVPFKSILCGVEGNESSTEAARQAVALAAAGAELRFMAVDASFELDADQASEQLERSLDEAVALARDAGVTATTDLGEGRYAVDVLLSEGAKYDLLVVGTQERSRMAGLVLGSTASESAHETDHPLLIARRSPRQDRFPGKVLLASDGSPGSWVPTRAAAALASACDSDLELLHVADGKHPDAGVEIEAQAAEIQQVTGVAPHVSQRLGSPTGEIVEAARLGGASLIVCGRRGLRGIKSLGSVSERVVHHAECSVLLIPAAAESSGSA